MTEQDPNQKDTSPPPEFPCEHRERHKGRDYWRRPLQEFAEANRIANKTMACQNALSYQQSVYQLSISGIAKCFELITRIDPNRGGARKRIKAYRHLIKTLNDLAQSVMEDPCDGANPPPPCDSEPAP